MKIEWKNFSVAMILSIIVTGILGLISSVTYIIIAIPDMPPGKMQYTIVTKDGTFLAMSLSGIIVLGLTCIFILTLVFYFLIGYLSKKKKQI
jgi:uncharacterized BrkB/YihY/UPF0761 family membrane protein